MLKSLSTASGVIRIRRCQPAVGDSTFFAERDHLLDVSLHCLRLGDGGLDALFDDQRGDEVPQQSAPVRCVPAQFPSCYTMTHDSILDIAGAAWTLAEPVNAGDVLSASGEGLEARGAVAAAVGR